MDIRAIFSIGVGKVNVPEAVPFGRAVFKENSINLLTVPIPGSTNHRTSLASYGAYPDIVEHEDTVNFRNVKEAIYVNGLKFLDGCGYDINKHDVEVSSIWINEIQEGSGFPAHAHYGAQVSGCFYVDVPANAGDIVFTNASINFPLGMCKVREYSQFTSDTWRFTPESGDMFFWRSDLQHQVLAARFVGVRRSIAFDIKVIKRADKA